MHDTKISTLKIRIYPHMLFFILLEINMANDKKWNWWVTKPVEYVKRVGKLVKKELTVSFSYKDLLYSMLLLHTSLPHLMCPDKVLTKHSGKFILIFLNTVVLFIYKNNLFLFISGWSLLPCRS